LTNLAGNGIFNSVCVKKCPNVTYKGKKLEGKCVKADDGGAGVVKTNWNDVVWEANEKKTVETC
jgi:hypothetical protein